MHFLFRNLNNEAWRAKIDQKMKKKWLGKTRWEPKKRDLTKKAETWKKKFSKKSWNLKNGVSELFDVFKVVRMDRSANVGPKFDRKTAVNRNYRKFCPTIKV